MKQYFNFWDKLISGWINGKYPSITYLPEPWWGWCPLTNKPLYSVAMNLQPGAGGSKQLASNQDLQNILKSKTYQKAVADGSLAQHLVDTQKWHLNNRAKPLLSPVLGNIIQFNQPIDYLSHHLSIEILPCHSATSKDLDKKVAQNLPLITKQIIPFAAEAAMNIAAGPYKNIVVVRCSARRFMNLFSNAVMIPMGNINISPCEFRFNDKRFKDVKFLCVWKAGAFNRIPKADIKKIINNTYNTTTTEY